MTLAESIRLAIGSLRSNRMRAFLTLLGVIIGIAAVIAIQTIGAGLQKESREAIESAGGGDFLLNVEPRAEQGDGRTRSELEDDLSPGPADALTPEDIDEIRARLGDSLAGIAVGQHTEIDGEAVPADDPDAEPAGGSGGPSYTFLKPTNSDAVAFDGNEIVAGRAYTEEEAWAGAPIALLSEDHAAQLFGSPEAALGQSILFTEQPDGGILQLRVVGVYQPRGANAGFLEESNTNYVFAPYGLLAELRGRDEGIMGASARAAATADKQEFAAELKAVAERLYANNDEFELTIDDLRPAVDSLDDFIGAMTLSISVIAGISLLVGGIGVMNIMLITVTERTREIGIRKAVGATRRDIRLQFVVESMIICLIGGAVGVLLGAAGGAYAASTFTSPAPPPLSGVLVALGISMGIGLFFGYYPANKAAKLDPIVALRAS